ncbi:MAG: hypothetical protein D6701_07140, partial [Gemmatimonadetes bacterium]
MALPGRDAGVTLLGLSVLLVAPHLAAQGPPTPPTQDTTVLVFEREVFEYPEYARRNPFRPLLTTLDGGPRFERLQLMGIIYSDDPAKSVAVFAAGPADGGGG